LLERQFDLSVNLQHPWTYEAMLHDLLGMHLNKVTITEQPTDGKVKPSRVYDLSINDAIWVDNAGRPFPNVTDDIEERLGTHFTCITGTKVQRLTQKALLAAWKTEYERISSSGAAGDPMGAGVCVRERVWV